MPIEKNELIPNEPANTEQSLFQDQSGFGDEYYTNNDVSFRRLGAYVAGAAAAGAVVIGGSAYAEDSTPAFNGVNQSVLSGNNLKPAESRNLEKENQRKLARCERQSELDAYAYTSCQYKGAYAAISKKHPAWLRTKSLASPGKEDKSDRKTLYFKTHPKVYARLLLENQAGANYKSPNFKLWEDGVNDNECKDTWNCNTGNGYYGGLQMDVQFQKTYNPTALMVWGVASNWPRNAQMLAADRAYNGYNGYGARGLGPWPTSRSEFGMYPAPIRKVVVPRLVLN